MPVIYQREELEKGISLIRLRDSKFKSERIKVTFILEPGELVYGLNLLPGLLVTSNSEHRTKAGLARCLSMLYGASIVAGNGRRGDYATVEVVLSFIGDRYTMDGEEISMKAADQLIKCILSPDLTEKGFNEDYFRLCKGELVDNILASVNNKRLYTFMKAEELIYEGEPYVANICRDPERAAALTQEEVIKAYELMKRSSRIEVYVCGDGTAEKAAETVAAALSALDRDEELPGMKARRNSPLKSEPAFRQEEMPLRQSKLMMAYKSSYEDIYVCKVFSAILGATPISKLFANVREKMSLCYYCSSIYADLKGTLMIDSGVDSCNADKLREAVGEQIESIKNGGFTDEELLNAKLFLSGAYISNMDSTGAMIGWYEAQSSRGTSYTPEEQSALVMAVTRQQIIDCAGSFELDSVFMLKAKEEEE